MWYKLGMGQSGVEEVTELPRSSIDLLALQSADDIEQWLLQ